MTQISRDQQEHPDWEQRLTHAIAGEIRRYRLRQGMSTQQLADRCAELGLPIKRSVLANLETKRRGVLTVAEMFVLAAALGVPPILLALPLGREEKIEILPGMVVGTWDAAYWWDGQAVIKQFSGAGPVLGPNPDENILMLRDAHAEAIYRVGVFGGNAEAITAAVAGLFGDDTETAASVLASMNQNMSAQIKALAEVRKEMRDAGIIPPPLPAAMEAIDDWPAAKPE